MDVTDFFYEFAGGEGVEVVVAGFPEFFAGALQEFGGFSLDDSESRGECVIFWFADEDVDVLGHEDVGEEGEFVGLPGPLNDLFEDVLWFWCREVGSTAVTTDGDEVELACVVTPF